MVAEHETRERGPLRIYLHADGRLQPRGSRWRLPREGRLSSRLVRWASEAGLSAAVLSRGGMGFLGSGPIVDDGGTESSHPRLIVCIELLGSRHALRGFADRHSDELRRATVTCHGTERWDPPRQDVLTVTTGAGER